jgi:hypothetical protein
MKNKIIEYETPYNDQNYKRKKNYKTTTIIAYERLNLNIINSGKLSKEVDKK